MEEKEIYLSNVVGNYRFMVEIENLLVASFSEVSGLVVETELEQYNEGGVNEYTHQLPMRTKHVPIVLKHGLTDSYELWDWYDDVVKGKIVRRSGSIILFDDQFREFRRWTFNDAFPSKWVGPELNASVSEVAIEQIELVHNGFKFL
ncbi:phage tail protein [Paenibacillus endoradicis]|uniref:phage tail protein n=1 Tax=Paenibacillus endoradicis TaxID=2972487 RepID=UPI0021599F94|nr:phage tail protein [Paenibacillus endoradicis]MCR8657449.1 phage tail protein [Paenibacillus endoradicis]